MICMNYDHNKKFRLLKFDSGYSQKIINAQTGIDQSKTFTLLFKSNILDFETLSRVHVYRIEYVSYRQGPYPIRIDTADDRIVPALAGKVVVGKNIPLL